MPKCSCLILRHYDLNGLLFFVTGCFLFPAFGVTTVCCVPGYAGLCYRGVWCYRVRGCFCYRVGVFVPALVFFAPGVVFRRCFLLLDWCFSSPRPDEESEVGSRRLPFPGDQVMVLRT